MVVAGSMGTRRAGLPGTGRARREEHDTSGRNRPFPGHARPTRALAAYAGRGYNPAFDRWGGSSIGRAPRSHRGGCEFDPHPLHFGSEGLPIGGPSSFCGLLSAFQGSAQTADRRSGAGSLSFAPHVHRCIARGLTFDLAFDAVGLVLRCCGPRFTRWWCCCRVIETWAPALAVCLEFRRGHHACGRASSPASAFGHPRH